MSEFFCKGCFRRFAGEPAGVGPSGHKVCAKCMGRIRAAMNPNGPSGYLKYTNKKAAEQRDRNNRRMYRAGADYIVKKFGS